MPPASPVRVAPQIVTTPSTQNPVFALRSLISSSRPRRRHTRAHPTHHRAVHLSQHPPPSPPRPTINAARPLSAVCGSSTPRTGGIPRRTSPAHTISSAYTGTHSHGPCSQKCVDIHDFRYAGRLL